MTQAKKNERANALKEVKRLCKEFGFTAGMLKGSLAEEEKQMSFKSKIRQAAFKNHYWIEKLKLQSRTTRILRAIP